MTSFADHFSGHAAAYASSRPSYPEALFVELARLAPARRLAWDCATGNGQAAVGLASRFERVVATDASAEQIAHATAHSHIDYRVGSETRCEVADGAVDLVTVAQAAHWLELPAFFEEVRRVLSPGGVVALWCYTLFAIEPQIDALISELHDQTLAADWPPERALVKDGYGWIELPFHEITLPRFAIERAWTLPELADYLRTWSAVQRNRRRTDRDPIVPLLKRLAAPWGDPAEPRRVRWPLHVRVGQKG